MDKFVDKYFMQNLNSTDRISLTLEEFKFAYNGGYKGLKKEDGKGYYEKYGDPIFNNIILENGITLSAPTSLTKLTIIDSIVKNILIFGSKRRKNDYGHLVILNSKTGNIQVHGEMGFIKITNSEIGDISIFNNIRTRDICISNSSIINFNCAATAIGKLEFFNTKINNLIISVSSIINFLNIDSHSGIMGELSVTSAKIYKINFQANELKKTRIYDSFIQTFNWQKDFNVSILYIEKCKIVNFIFHKSIISKDSVIQISDTAINYLKCSYFVNTAWLILSNLEPLTEYERFREKDSNLVIESGEYLFEKIKNAETFIHFENSDLGRTSFVNCDLNAFNNFVFYNTKMLEIFMAGTHFPTEINKFTLPKGIDEQLRNEQERLAYGQFKRISDIRGDSVQGTEFLSLEMYAYENQIQNEHNKLGERFNLWLNRISNNWGNDWVKAIKITLLVNMFCFTAYTYSLGYRMFGTDFNLFLDLTSYSLEFLNPLRKADFLKDLDNTIEINWLARIIDYISRIIIAFFTYQTIQAFRRFGKKTS